MAEYKVIEWATIENAIDIIKEKVLESKIEYEVIYGPPRGGLIPGVMLSHRLRIPLVLNMEEVWRIDMQHKKVLIVDDISDSGRTMQYFKDKNFDIATLYLRYNSMTVPKYHAYNIDNDDWLLFPWETSDTTESNL